MKQIPIKYYSFAIIFIWSSITFFSLDYFPLTWFDEVYLVSISQTWFEKGNLVAEVTRAARNGKEALTYGPVFYSLQGLFVHLFGLSSTITRLLGLLAVLMIVIPFTVEYSKTKWSLIILCLFLMNPLVNLTLREGRPDILAVGFIVISIFSLQRKAISLGAFFSVMAMLTHPRSVVLLIPLLIYVCFFSSYTKKQIIVFLSINAIIYLSWSIYAFGSPIALVDYYLVSAGGNATAKAGFIGGGNYFPKMMWGVYVLFGLAVINKIITKKFNKLEVFSLISLFLFYTLFKDYGTYSIIILPCFFIWIFNLRLRAFKLIALCFLCFDFTLLSYKVLQAKTLSFEKQFDNVKEEVFKDFSRNEKIIGPARYYYHAKQKDVKYQLCDKYNTPEERARLLDEDFRFDYLLVPSHVSVEDKNYKPYFENCNLVLVKTYSFWRDAPRFWFDDLPFQPHTEIDAYAVKVYKRER